MMPQTIRKISLPKRAVVVRHTRTRLNNVSKKDLYEMVKKELGKMALLTLKTEALSDELARKNNAIQNLNRMTRTSTIQARPELSKAMSTKRLVDKLSREAEKLEKERKAITKRTNIIEQNINLIKENMMERKTSQT